MKDRPEECEGCAEAEAPIYPFNIAISSPGWTNTVNEAWLCADCQYKLSFEKGWFQ